MLNGARSTRLEDPSEGNTKGYQDFSPAHSDSKETLQVHQAEGKLSLTKGVNRVRIKSTKVRGR